MNIPDSMPTLAAMAHYPESGKACLLEYISFINGEEWGWKPRCVHPALQEPAWRINDTFADEYRHLLVPFIGLLSGTSSATFRNDSREREFEVFAAHATGEIKGMLRIAIHAPDPTLLETAHKAAAREFDSVLQFFAYQTGYDFSSAPEVTTEQVKQAELKIKEMETV